MDIQFYSNFSLELLEFDQRTPSMRFRCGLQVNYSSSQIKFDKENLWIECRVWDGWILGLEKIQYNQVDEAVLHDIDKDIFIRLDRRSGIFVLEVHLSLVEINRPLSEIKVAISLCDDDFYSLIKSSKDFPIIW